MKILGLPSLLASVAAIGVGAGLTYAVASLISGSPDDQRGSMQIATVTATATLDAGQERSTATPTGTAPTPTATAPFTGLLLDRKRDRLAICVAGVGVSEDDVTRAKTAVEGSLQRLSSDRIWIRVGLSNPPPVVEAGCPSAPAVYSQRNKDHPDFPFIIPNPVTEPSYFKIHFFVMPDEEVERISNAGPPPIVGTREEVFCKVPSEPGPTAGDVCSEVTAGIYIGTSELNDEYQIDHALAKQIGLY